MIFINLDKRAQDLFYLTFKRIGFKNIESYKKNTNIIMLICVPLLVKLIEGANIMILQIILKKLAVDTKCIKNMLRHAPYLMNAI